MRLNNLRADSRVVDVPFNTQHRASVRFRGSRHVWAGRLVCVLLVLPLPGRSRLCDAHLRGGNRDNNGRTHLNHGIFVGNQPSCMPGHEQSWQKNEEVVHTEEQQGLHAGIEQEPNE